MGGGAGQRTIAIESDRALPVFPAASVGVAHSTHGADGVKRIGQYYVDVHDPVTGASIACGVLARKAPKPKANGKQTGKKTGKAPKTHPKGKQRG